MQIMSNYQTILSFMKELNGKNTSNNNNRKSFLGQLSKDISLASPQKKHSLKVDDFMLDGKDKISSHEPQEKKAELLSTIHSKPCCKIL